MTGWIKLCEDSETRTLLLISRYSSQEKTLCYGTLTEIFHCSTERFFQASNYELEERFCHRPCCMADDMVKLESGLVEEDPVLDRLGLRAKAGFFGVGTVAISPPSMKSTFDIVGRSLGSSCTHRRATFIHFRTSCLLQRPSRTGSVKSIALLSDHSLHACTNVISHRLCRHLSGKDRNSMGE